MIERMIINLHHVHLWFDFVDLFHLEYQMMQRKLILVHHCQQFLLITTLHHHLKRNQYPIKIHHSQRSSFDSDVHLLSYDELMNI